MSEIKTITLQEAIELTEDNFVSRISDIMYSNGMTNEQLIQALNADENIAVPYTIDELFVWLACPMDMTLSTLTRIAYVLNVPVMTLLKNESTT